MKGDGGLCAVCKAKAGTETVNCAKCEAPHCRSCWDYNFGRCAIFACGSVRVFQAGIESVADRYAGNSTRGYSSAAFFFGLSRILLFSLLATTLLIPGWLAICHKVKTGEVVARTNIFSGNLYDIEILREGQSYSWLFSVPTSYYLSSRTVFYGVKVIFNDNRSATIEGEIEYTLDPENIRYLHIVYGSQKRMEEDRLLPTVRSAFLYSAGLFTSPISRELSSYEFERRLLTEIDRSGRLERFGVRVTSIRIGYINIDPRWPIPPSFRYQETPDDGPGAAF